LYSVSCSSYTIGKLKIVLTSYVTIVFLQQKLPRCVVPNEVMDEYGEITLICHDKTNFRDTYSTAPLPMDASSSMGGGEYQGSEISDTG
jgi:hypothetical protein